MTSATTTDDKYLFFADIARGHCLKIVVDVLTGPLKRLVFGFTQNGINLCQSDDSESMLFFSSFQREKIRKYIFTKELSRSINASHLRKQLRTVKKKDMISIFIEKDRQNTIGIIITPDTNSKINRIETIYIVAQEEEKWLKFNTPSRSSYHFPMVIDSSGFQKVKKQFSMGKPILIEMDEDRFLSFFCDAGEVYSSRFEFGTRSVSKTQYHALFDSNKISSLVKLPGLNKQMQFYAPKDNNPLLIRVDAENLGFFEIYIVQDAELNTQTHTKTKK